MPASQSERPELLATQRLHHAFTAFADRPALVTATETLTYQQLGERVEAYRTTLRAAIPAGHSALIGFLTSDTADAYAALLAILLQGHAYVPLNPHHPLERNKRILDQAKLQWVLTATPRLSQALPHPDEGGYQLLAPATDKASFSTPTSVQPSGLAYLLFTSGSTGQPKGVPLHHRQLAAFLAAVLDDGLYDFTPEDRFLQTFELTFDLSIFSTLVPLCVGACCYVLPNEGIGPLKVYEWLEDHAITVCLMVPSVLAHLKPYFAEIELPSLRYSLFCGEALPYALATAWHQCCSSAQLENVYGPTEATIFCTRYPVAAPLAAQEQRHGVVAIGTPLTGMQCLLLTETGDVLGPDSREVMGELLLIGDQVTTGYWHNPSKTAAAFRTISWQGEQVAAYRTGDLAAFNARGQLVYLGRTDAQVKIEGYRVELGEIEHHIRQHTGQDQAAVIAVPNANGRMLLQGFTEPFAGEVDAVLEALKNSLPPYMLPRSLTILDALPLNANGKIDRVALRQLVHTATPDSA